MKTAKTDEKKQSNVWDAWHEEADSKSMTLEKLPAFLKKLAEHKHDYNSCIHAVAAGAVATAWAINREPNLGITGFQASGVMWEFMRHYNGIEAPASLLQFKDMLYPQSAYKFEREISKETWEWLQKEAKELIAKSGDSAHPNVAAHWASIALGEVPFGFTVAGLVLGDPVPAPEQPEEEHATSPEQKEKSGKTVIQGGGGKSLEVQNYLVSVRISIEESQGWPWIYLGCGAITQLRDALSAFVGDGEKSAGETKPTAEVIAEHGELKIVVIDGVGFLVFGGATTMHGDPSPGLNRAAAQAYLLAWGHDPADAQAATQAIDA